MQLVEAAAEAMAVAVVLVEAGTALAVADSMAEVLVAAEALAAADSREAIVVTAVVEVLVDIAEQPDIDHLH